MSNNKGMVWITRSENGSAQSRAAWDAAGFSCVIKPVVDISIATVMPKPLPDNATILITSQNALRILAALTDRRDWPVMTVGDASARLARKIGFEDVLSAKGNAQDLFAMVQKVYKPATPRVFVYASGSQIRLNLAKALRDKGFKARRDIYYNNEMSPPVDVKTVANVTHIALYSPMAAKAVRRYAGQLNKVKTISISPETDEALQTRYKNRRLVANRPSERAMIAAVLS